MSKKSPVDVLEDETATDIGQCSAGQILGSRWRVRRRVGKGTFSEIYEASDLKQGRGSDGRHPHVAIKVAREGQKRSMLQHEEEVLVALQPCGAVPTFVEIGRDKECHYLVMQLLGENLSNMRRLAPDKRLSLRMVVLIGAQIVDALGRMHELGYIHRDIKPSNCCVGLQDDNTCFLLDFGLVRRLSLGALFSRRAALCSSTHTASPRHRSLCILAASPLPRTRTRTHNAHATWPHATCHMPHGPCAACSDESHHALTPIDAHPWRLPPSTTPRHGGGGSRAARFARPAPLQSFAARADTPPSIPTCTRRCARAATPQAA